jgi:WD40 repeat protein
MHRLAAATIAAVFAVGLLMPGPGAQRASPQILRGGTGPVSQTLQVQLGHVMPVFHLSWSADGALLASADMRGRVKLWNASAAAELRTVGIEEGAKGHNDLVLDPMGRWIAAATDGGVRLFDTRTGRELPQLRSRSKVVKIATNATGSMVVGLTARGLPVVWNSANWSVIPAFAANVDIDSNPDQREVADTWGNHPLMFTPDGRSLILAILGEPIERVDLESGRTDSIDITLSGVTAFVSPDGRFAGSFDYRSLRLVQLDQRPQDETIPFASDGARGITFCDGGRRLAVSDQSDVTIIDRSTPANRQRLHFEGNVTAIAFNTCDRLAVGFFDGRIEMFRLSDSTRTTTLGRRSIGIEDVFLDDERHVLKTVSAVGLFEWPLTEGRVTLTERWVPDEVRARRFTPDGRLTIATVDSQSAEANGISLDGSRVPPGTNPVLADDSTRAAVLDFETTSIFAVRRVARANVTPSGSAPTPLVRAQHDHASYYGVFSPSGRWFASALLSGAIVLLDGDSGRVHVLAGHMKTVQTLAFSADEQTLFSGDAGGELRAWGGASWSVAAKVGSASGAGVTALTLSPDGGRVAVGYSDGLIEERTVDLRPMGAPLTGHSAGVRCLRYSQSGWLVSATRDSIRLWGPRADQRVTLVLEPDGQWLVATDAGTFDTNAIEDLGRARWTFSDDPLRSLAPELFIRDYFEPRLLQRLLAGERLPIVRSLASLNRVQPTVEIEPVRWVDAASGRAQVAVRVSRQRVTIARGGVSTDVGTDVYDLRVFCDGQLVAWSPTVSDVLQPQPRSSPAVVTESDVKEWRRSSRIKLRRDGTARLVFEIQVPRQDDLMAVMFSAYAFNEDRVKSATAQQTAPRPSSLTTRRGTAYVIAVGVNRTDSSNWQLQYAVNDARAMASVVSARLRVNSQFAAVVPVTLTSDEGAPRPGEAAATKRNLKTVLDLLAGRSVTAQQRAAIPDAFQLQRAEPEDVVLLAVSSHGYTDGQGVFHFVLADTGSVPGSEVTPALDAHTLSSDDLSIWLRSVMAGELVLIVDACQSEATINTDGFKPGPMGSRGLGQLAYDKGMRVLAASKAQEAAVERGGSLRQGLLTYALVRSGLEQRQADFQPPDGRIELNEWLAYAVAAVPKLFAEGDSRGTIGVPGDRGQERAGFLGQRRTPMRYQQPVLFDFAKRTRPVPLL